jgi:hypothetical protein
MFLSVMFTVMAYRRRNWFNQELPEEHAKVDVTRMQAQAKIKGAGTSK